MSVNRFAPPGDADTRASLTQVSQVFDDLSPIASYPVSSARFLQVAAGATQRCAPRAAGQNVVIPAATGANFNQTITLFMENALGTLRVRAASGTINGAASFTLAAGYTTLIVLRSNGFSGWVTERASGFPVAGNSLSYSGETLNYIGSTTQITLTGITGNQGTVDISALACGGSVFISAPTGNWIIDGFSGNNTPGFWFNILVGNSAFTGTLTNESAVTQANRMRISNAVDVVGTRLQAIVYYQAGGANRWSVISAPTIPAGRLLARTVYTTGTAAVHNHAAGATTCLIEGVGGGGAAGGVTTTAGSAGSGGGSGTWGQRFFAITAATSTYTVGAGGTGAAGTGGNGTASTWLHNATTTTLPAGQGGTALAGGVTIAFAAPGGLGGAAATNADDSTVGERGGVAYRPIAASTPCFGGAGGSNPLGNDGKFGHTVGTVDAGAAGGPGSGAGGTANGTTVVAANGVNGAAGIWIVEEYS